MRRFIEFVLVVLMVLLFARFFTALGELRGLALAVQAVRDASATQSSSEPCCCRCERKGGE